MKCKQLVKLWGYGPLIPCSFVTGPSSQKQVCRMFFLACSLLLSITFLCFSTLALPNWWYIEARCSMKMGAQLCSIIQHICSQRSFHLPSNTYSLYQSSFTSPSFTCQNSASPHWCISWIGLPHEAETRGCNTMQNIPGHGLCWGSSSSTRLAISWWLWCNGSRPPSITR